MGTRQRKKTADPEIPTENSDAVSQDTSPDPISEDSSDLSDSIAALNNEVSPPSDSSDAEGVYDDADASDGEIIG